MAVVVVAAEGYMKKSIEITPDRNQDVRVDLKRRKSGGTGSRTPGKDEIIHEVPGLTK